MGVHPSEIGKGYTQACVKASRELETLPTPLILPTLTFALKPAFATKQFDSEDILAALVAEAALAVMPTREKGFNVDNVRVIKIMGDSLSESKVVRGMVFGWESDGTIKHATAAKVAVFTCALDVAQTETEGTMLIENADKMLNFTSGEEHLEKIIKEIAASGIKVIIAHSISDLALHYLNHHSIAVLKVPSKFDLRRLCRVVNATPLERMGMPTPEEAGWVDVYETVELNGDSMTVLRQLVAGDPVFETISGWCLRGRRSWNWNWRGGWEERAGAACCEQVHYGGVGGYPADVGGECEWGGGGKGTMLIVSIGGDQETTEPSNGARWGVVMEAESPSDSNSLPYPILDSLAAILLATEAALSVLGLDSKLMSKQAGDARQRNRDIHIPLRLIIVTSTFTLLMIFGIRKSWATMYNFTASFL
ncbi:hypothetical protein PILCRDRAFT_12926 [Piloderma croceum F 1598]|uniref:Uncharacterized protein n=1 Tax=Piloderma croceum (strain F 1598) TaxID=765440 RepID=A0A0C3F8S6_PILCF|nr:hypothetical protein PILCRDRAFT_12926 [Piloderma croceum F 1598]